MGHSPTALLLLAFASVLTTVSSQSCKWKNGQEATDYYACDPTADQSSCCLQGEACVTQGFCYGSLGIIYRGACAGGWGNDTACPQQCNNAGADGSWSNFLQCPSISAPEGATSWWCGDSSVVTPCDESGTSSNPTKAQIFSLPWNGMLPLALMPWPTSNFTGCAISQANEYSVTRQIENATDHESHGSGSSSSNTTTTTTVEKKCPNGAKIGEGVAIGVVALLALAMAGWALYERKQKNKLLAGGGLHKQQETQQYQRQAQPHHQQYYDQSTGHKTPAPEYRSPNRQPVPEMDSFGRNGRPHAHEMQS